MRIDRTAASLASLRLRCDVSYGAVALQGPFGLELPARA
jgi:hypothetical protein